MKSLLRIFFLILIILVGKSIPNNAQDMAPNNRWYVPTYIPFQFAGDLGFFSTGIGYNVLKNRCHTGLTYGYVPASISNERIHLISLKNAFVFRKLSFDRNKTTFPYAGFAAIAEVAGNSFLTQPSYYPKGYYAQNALHFSGFVGVKHQRYSYDQERFIKGIEFFIETGAMDFYLYYTFTQKEIKPHQIFSLAIGINFLLAPQK